MLLFLFYVDGLAYSLVWVTIIPPFTYFLLGRAGGTVLSVITFIACIYLVRMQYESALPLTITKGALLNVIEAAFVQVLLFRFYEGTRHKAFLQLKAKHKESKRQSETDYLTGAFNRGKFFSLVTELLAKNSANEHYLVILDIDDFKCVNDKFGHDVGDSVLKMFTQTLKTQIRDKDILARWGGEEFVLLLTNLSSYDAQRRIEAILELLTLNNGSYGPISFSAGITPCQRGVPLGHLIKYADTALYEAKNSGKGRVIIYSDD
ncbi:MAG: GGDEF domain-containing protein [Alteromonas sp.]|nr:GGDEF domain-containing protein [Alteromonas sp.]